MLAARPEVEVEPVVGHVEPLPGVGSEAARQWRQSLVISTQSRQDEGPVEVDGAGGGRGVLYHGGSELQPDGLPVKRKNYFYILACVVILRLRPGNWSMSYSI